MPRLLPPSAKRARAARAVGLRPRASLLVLAGLAASGAVILELWPRWVAWLGAWLESGSFTGVTEPLGVWAGAGLVVLLMGLTIAVVLVGPRRRARRMFGVGPEAEAIPVAIALALVVVATLLITAVGRGALAGAARSVDAPTAALTSAWLAWTRRGLIALAAAALGVGVLERLLSARALWRALHQTPAQARRDARESSRR